MSKLTRPHRVEIVLHYSTEQYVNEYNVRCLLEALFPNSSLAKDVGDEKASPSEYSLGRHPSVKLVFQDVDRLFPKDMKE